jgi:hypothetical protein
MLFLLNSFSIKSYDNIIKFLIPNIRILLTKVIKEININYIIFQSDSILKVLIYLM